MKKELVESESLDLEQFKELDYFAVNEYRLPIELMMENAGYHLARLISKQFNADTTIKIGVGNGNNGGGGLVAARRLAGWGYSVYLDLATEITKELPKTQLDRALKFGAVINSEIQTQVWVDAYLGFSQRLPLNDNFLKRILKANKSDSYKISLDLPTGYLGDVNSTYFNAEQVLTLAAPKTILNQLPSNVEILVADLGIPLSIYKKFNVIQPSFSKEGFVKHNRT